MWLPFSLSNSMRTLASRAWRETSAQARQCGGKDAGVPSTGSDCPFVRLVESPASTSAKEVAAPSLELRARVSYGYYTTKSPALRKVPHQYRSRQHFSLPRDSPEKSRVIVAFINIFIHSLTARGSFELK